MYDSLCEPNSQWSENIRIKEWQKHSMPSYFNTQQLYLIKSGAILVCF